MLAISNAFLHQADAEQRNHWNNGPLEFAYFDEKSFSASYAETICSVIEWNCSYEGGYCRDAETIEKLQQIAPWLETTSNTNIFFVCKSNGFSQLDVMLGSVVPIDVLHRHGILQKKRANFWLHSFCHYDEAADYGRRCRLAFEEYIWKKLQRTSRCKQDFFSHDSPIRLLARDTDYWISRLYRIAIDRYEAFPPTSHEDEKWESLDHIERKLVNEMGDLAQYDLTIRRPRMGGMLWDIENEQECEEAVDDMLDGLGLMDPIDPLLDLLHSHRVHEDFSPCYSWIKEDFERSFYSKRSQVKVEMVETIDEFPSSHVNERFGHEDVLFRDLLCCFDRRDQRLLIALRHGKTMSEIANDLGHRGHAAISRRVKKIKERVMKLLK